MPGRHGHAALAVPSPWVLRFAPIVPPGEVLDLACGSGRHARLFAARGHAVLAVDRDAASLAQLTAHGDRDLVTLQLDLEIPPVENMPGVSDAGVWPFDASRFAAIIVTNYLYRPLMPFLTRSLMPGGVLIYETFARGNERFGKPSNPDFLLMPGELLQLAADDLQPSALRVLAFEDGYVDHPAPAMMQRICLVRIAEGELQSRLALG